MKARGRWAALSVLTALAMSPAIPAVGVDGRLTPAGDQAFTQLASCIASGDHSGLDVIFVVDESASLRVTDPESRRSQALAAAVAALRDLDRSLKPLNKSVRLAGATFAKDYVERLPWSDADNPRVNAFVDSVANLDDGTATNYVAALSGARRSLTDRGAACKAIFWFTDGKLDVGDAAQNEAAWNSLLAKGGLPDSLRLDQVALVALPLFSRSAPPELKANNEDKARLQALAEGVGRSGAVGATAGTLVGGAIPSEAQGGAYIESGDPSALSLYFSRAVARASGYSEGQLVKCPTTTDCPKGRLGLQIDPGIGHTRVLVATSNGPGVIKVTAPNGTTAFAREPGKDARVEVGDVDASLRWSPGLAQLDFDLPSGTQGTGRWIVQLDPTRPAEVVIVRRSGLQVSLQAQRPPLIAGTETTLRLAIATPDGSQVPADLYRTLSVRAALDGQQLADASRTDDGQYAVSVKAGSIGGPTRLLTTVEATTASGINLEVVAPTFPLSVLPPDSFPRIESLQFPAALGDSPVSGTLTLSGAADTDTQVRLDGIEFTGPDGSTASAISGISADQVIDVGAGARVEIPVVFSPSQSVDGVAVGELRATLISAEPGESPIEQRTPFDITMTRPINEPVRWGYVALFVIVSLLFPLLLLWLTGRHLARFSWQPSVTRVAEIPATLSVAGQRRRDGRAGGLTADDFTYRVSVSPDRRSAEVGSIRFNATARFPLYEPRGTATATSGRLVLPTSPFAVAPGTQVPVSLGDGITWLMCVDDDALATWLSSSSDEISAPEESIDVTVVVILGGNASLDEAAAVMSGFHQGRAALEALRYATRESASYASSAVEVAAGAPSPPPRGVPDRSDAASSPPPASWTDPASGGSQDGLPPPPPRKF